MSQEKKQHPPKYWNDFARVEEALLLFIASYGTPGFMPTRRELKAAGRGDLAAAIDKHGGFEAVAERLRLHYPVQKKRPNGYWKELTNLMRELRVVAAALSIPEVMPTETQLLAAGHSSLVRAIHLHGHFEEIAHRAELRFRSNTKPTGYWNEETIKQAILEFNRERGVRGIMPKRRELEQTGRADLASAIDCHGGYRRLAAAFGLEPSYRKQVDGHWDRQETVDAALQALVREHGTPGVMPTAAQLRKWGEGALLDAISRKYGGLSAEAQHLGYAIPDTTREDGYWNDLANVERELREYISLHGTEGVMPTYAELQRANLSSLCAGIRQHGTFASLAEQFGLFYQPGKRRDGYWDDLAHVQLALLEHNERYGMGDIMPTARELRQHGYASLVRAFRHHNGAATVAHTLGFTIRGKNHPRGHWTRETLAEELHAFMLKHHLETMPTADILIRAGRGDLSGAVTKLGGYPVVAQEVGIPGSGKRPPHSWTLEAIRQELTAFAAERGNPGIMPRQRDLQEAGRYDLVKAIQEAGGALVVARQFGLHYDSVEKLSRRTVEDVEHKARAIQLLAESGLLSGAQTGIILRRAGMLDYRNLRVKYLNASLIEGDHSAIERAFASLATMPEGEETDATDLEVADQAHGEAGDIIGNIEGEAGRIVDEYPAFSTQPNIPLMPDLGRERMILRGLSALGAAKLPLDEVLGMLTSRLLWNAFYRRLYIWYGSLRTPNSVSAEDVRSAILSVYPEHQDNEFVAEASLRFTFEVECAVKFAACLPEYGWAGPRLRLHQADAASKMAKVLASEGGQAFLLNADEPGLGKSAAFLAAVAASGITSVVLVAPMDVSDDTWAGSNGEIRRCLPHARVERGLPAALRTLTAAAVPSLTFYVLHYEELLRCDGLASLTSFSFDCLCIDEAHLIKQRAWQSETQRRQALEVLRAASRTAIGLSGTPLVNELAEPLSILQVLSQNNPCFDYTRLNQHRLSDIIDVFEAMLPHITRRRKEQVLLHLPSCDVQIITTPLPANLTERVRDVCKWPSSKAGNALQELRRLSLEAKLPVIRARAEASDKLLILTYFSDGISERIAAELDMFFPRQVAHIDHSVPKGKRGAILQAFRNPRGLRILVGTVGTIGTGLTLFDPNQEDTAHEIIVADLPYTAAEFDQGIARLHREGQKRQVMVEVLQTSTTLRLRDGVPLQTIDQQVWNLVIRKGELARSAIDGAYTVPNDAKHVLKALRRWLKHAREIGTEPLAVRQRPTEQSEAQRWRRELARLRGMSATQAHEQFAECAYTQAYLAHLESSLAAKLAHAWLRDTLKYLLRPDLEIVDMGCGLNPFADLPCRVTGLDRFDRPGQIRGTLEDPPLSDESADILIYSLSLYGTAEDLKAYFTHAARILRRGGHLLIVEPKAAFTPGGLSEFVRDLGRFGFELAGGIHEIRAIDGTVLTGMRLTLTGERDHPEVARFARKVGTAFLLDRNPSENPL